MTIRQTLPGRSLTTYTATQMPGATDSAASFEFLNEDHTLGNALRYVIMKKYVKATAETAHWRPNCASREGTANARKVQRWNSAAIPFLIPRIPK